MIIDLKTADGKYHLLWEECGHFHCLRYETYWRNLVGDNMVLSLAQEIQASRKAVEDIREQFQRWITSKNAMHWGFMSDQIDTPEYKKASDERMAAEAELKRLLNVT